MSYVAWETVRVRYARRTAPKAEICAHCGREVSGYAAVNGQQLCHPDYGLDCYRLVTIYKHPMPCPCRHATSEHPDLDVCDRCQYRRFEHQVDGERTRKDFLGRPVPCFDFAPKSFAVHSGDSEECLPF